MRFFKEIIGNKQWLEKGYPKAEHTNDEKKIGTKDNNIELSPGIEGINATAEKGNFPCRASFA